MDDIDGGRRAVLLSGLGASALTGSVPRPVVPHIAALTCATPDGTFPSVTDFGAVGDGIADDAPAFQKALTSSTGALVIAPLRRGGYRLGLPVTVPPRTALWFVGEAGQPVVRSHDGDLFILQSGGRVTGGDFDGGGAEAGSGFRFDPGTGQQRVERVSATRGWRVPIARYRGDGGSQSHVADFSFACDIGDRRAFAVAMEGSARAGAAPRHFRGGDFNGAPSFDFDGCSIVSINGVYCGALRFTDTSRGVMISDCRVGNQPTLEVRGSDHVLIAGWFPRLTLARGADNCLISGFYNSGYVRDLSGNGRNLVDFWYHEVAPSPSVVGAALPVLGPSQAAIARAGATYTYRFGFALDLRRIGGGPLLLDLPDGVGTSAAADQWGTGMLQVDGRPGLETLALRVLPKGERRAVMVYAGGQPLGGRTGIARLTGNITFSA